MHRTLPSLFALLCALLLAVAAFDAFADCDPCPRPEVILYDFTVDVPRPGPESGGALGEWFDLFFAASRAGAELFNDHACIRFFDGAALKDNSGEVGGGLIVGVDHPHLPPTGDIGGRDYLFTGAVSGGPGNYRVQLSLETACKRQVAHTASGSAATVEEAEELARTLAREQFRPLLQTIRRFEREQRAQNSRVALARNFGDTLSMEPAKRDAKPFETVPVQFTLVDCDGEPLAGRVISLTSQDDASLVPYNGHFAVPKATTDGNGKATVDFLVGGETGVAIPRSSFRFLRPTGCDGIDVAETSINVEGSAALYEVRFEYHWEKAAVTEHNEDLPGGYQSARQQEREDLAMQCLGVWKNPPDAQRDGYIELSGPPEAGCLPTGDYRDVEVARDRAFVSQESNSPDLTGSSMLRTGHLDRLITGHPLRSEPVDLYFWYQDGAEPGTPQFNISVPFETFHKVTSGGLERIAGGGKVFETPFSDAQSDHSTTSFSGSVADSTFKKERASIVVTGKYESTEDEAESRTTKTATLKVVITPIRKLADSAASDQRK